LIKGYRSEAPSDEVARGTFDYSSEIWREQLPVLDDRKEKRPSREGLPNLLTKIEIFEHLAVALDASLLHIVEEAPPLTDQLQKTTTRVVVFGVRLEMFGEVVDPLRDQRDLNFAGSGVVGREAILLLNAGNDV